MMFYLHFAYPAPMIFQDFICMNGNLWYKSAKDGKKLCALPRYLDLCLYFSGRDPIAETRTLDRWPELRLILRCSVPGGGHKGDANLYGALAQQDRNAASNFSWQDRGQTGLQSQWSSNFHT